MKYLLPTLWCLLLASAIACNKDKKKYTCIAQGKVVEAATGRPIERVRVKLQDGVGNSGPINVGNTSSGISSEGYTDSNGEFNLKLEGEYSPFVSASKEKYYDFNGKAGLIQGLKIGTNSNLVFTLESEARFEGVFKNNTSDLTSSLSIVPLSYKDKRMLQSGTPYSGNGPHTFFKDIGLLVPGDRYFAFELYINRNGSTQKLLDSVFMKPFETYRDTIYY